MYGYGPLILIVLPFFVLGLAAQGWVMGSFRRWSRVALLRGMSGAEVAQYILQSNGVTGVGVEVASGMLSDHYDPRTKVVRLSEGVYGGRSVASAAIAAHEVGHALQDAAGYAPLKLRSAAVPAAMAADKVVFVLILAGMFLQHAGGVFFLMAGLIYAVTVALALVTLPVEFNASGRALAQLTNTGIVFHEEIDGARGVLTAAASTYVVAALASIATMLYYLMLASRR
jgi:hypothetical protein